MRRRGGRFRDGVSGRRRGIRRGRTPPPRANVADIVSVARRRTTGTDARRLAPRLRLCPGGATTAPQIAFRASRGPVDVSSLGRTRALRSASHRASRSTRRSGVTPKLKLKGMFIITDRPIPLDEFGAASLAAGRDSRSPPRRSRLFRPTLSDLECVAELIPPIPPYSRPDLQRQHRGRRLSVWRRVQTPPARSPDSHPDPAPLRTRRALPRTPLRYLPTTSVARPSAAARLPLALPVPPAASQTPSSPPAPPPIVASPPPLSLDVLALALTAYRTIDGDVRVSAPRAHGSHRREQFRANRRRRRRRRTRRTQTPARRREGRRGRRGRRRRHRRYRRGVPRDGIHLFIGARAEIRTRTSRGGGRQLGKLGGVVSRSIALGGVDGPRGRHIGLASRGRQGQGQRDRHPHRVVSPRAVRLEATRQSVPRELGPRQDLVNLGEEVAGSILGAHLRRGRPFRKLVEIVHAGVEDVGRVRSNGVRVRSGAVHARVVDAVLETAEDDADAFGGARRMSGAGTEAAGARSPRERRSRRRGPRRRCVQSHPRAPSSSRSLLGLLALADGVSSPSRVSSEGAAPNRCTGRHHRARTPGRVLCRASCSGSTWQMHRGGAEPRG